MTTIAASIEIDAAPEKCWEVLTDWTGQSEWMPMTTVVVEAGDGALGTRLRARTGLGPAAVADPMVVDVWRPPHRCEVKHEGRVVTGRGIFLVEPRGRSRTKVTWEEQLDSRGVRRYLDRAAAAPTRAMLSVALRRLAEQVRIRS